ncbi:MAG: lipoate---protein ligase [Actinomycetota bacterium]|nr:lipoate---protein ligase [Actinomycetota bacterium]
MGTGWRVEVIRDGFGERSAARPVGERSVVVLDVVRPTLVLGSSQKDDVVDWDRVRERGAEVVRRRSGGSAVLVEPGAAVWVDVTIPAGDPRWDHDVGRAFHWLGAVWAEVLDAGLPAGRAARWHDGPMQRTPWSASVCFAGLGPGEITVDGRKVVGMSQRRTREAALFQCCAALRWEPERLLDLLALDDAARALGAAELADVAAGIGRDVDLVGGLVDALSVR